MTFVNLALCNDGAALADFSVLVGDFFFRAYPFSVLVIVHVAAGNLDCGCGEQRPLTENQMNLVIGFALESGDRLESKTVCGAFSDTASNCRRVGGRS